MRRTSRLTLASASLVTTACSDSAGGPTSTESAAYQVGYDGGLTWDSGPPLTLAGFCLEIMTGSLLNAGLNEFPDNYTDFLHGCADTGQR